MYVWVIRFDGIIFMNIDISIGSIIQNSDAELVVAPSQRSTCAIKHLLLPISIVNYLDHVPIMLQTSVLKKIEIERKY